MAQNINKEKNTNKLPLVFSIVSIILIILSIIINILWFQFLYDRSQIVQKNIIDLHTKLDN